MLEWPAPRFLNSSFFPYSPFLLILFKMERTNLYTKVCHFIDTSIIPKRTSLHRFFSNQSHEHPHSLKSYKVAVLCHLCPTLCDPLDYSPPACSVHGIFQARIQEWVAISFSRGFSWHRDRTHVSCVYCTAGRFFVTEPLGKPIRWLL